MFAYDVADRYTVTQKHFQKWRLRMCPEINAWRNRSQARIQTTK